MAHAFATFGRNVLSCLKPFMMKPVFLCCLALFVFMGCKKETSSKENTPKTTASKVDIYLLKSFTVKTGQTNNLLMQSISDAVLEDAPLVADKDIAYYDQSTTSFKLKKDISASIKDLDLRHGFAVTVNSQPVYFGRIYPGYMEFIAFGVAIIDPLFYHDNELKIRFPLVTNASAALLQQDKRNDDRITGALQASGRLR